MPILSTVIVTTSGNDTIERCLQSVRAISNEIIIIDISPDSWVDPKRLNQNVAVTLLAKQGITECEARILGISKATSRYVLCLHANEAVSDALKNHLTLHGQNLSAPAYSVRCVNHIGSEPIQSGPLKPNSETRIIDKTSVQATCGESGFVTVNSKGVRAMNLRLELHRYQFGSIQQLKEETEQNALKKAEYLHSINVSYSVWVATLRVTWAALYAFFITFAFTDIPYGIQTAVQHVRFTYLLHKHLRLLNNYGTTERRLTKGS